MFEIARLATSSDGENGRIQAFSLVLRTSANAGGWCIARPLADVGTSFDLLGCTADISKASREDRNLHLLLPGR